MNRRLKLALMVLTLTALVVLVFWPVCRNEFVNWDDVEVVVRNPDFQAESLARGWPPQRWWYWSAFPVTYTLWWGQAQLDYAWASAEAGEFVLRPIIFHATSLLLHLASTLLVFGILRRLIRHSPVAAWLGAVVFALHPLQVETVAWVNAQPTLVCAAASLWAVWQYLVAAHARESAASRLYVLLMISATLGCIAAMLAKPGGVVVPLIVVVLELCVLKRPVRVWGPWVGLWVALSVPVALFTMDKLPAPASVVSPLWARPAIALDATGFYLCKLAMPIGLCADYGRSPRWLLAHPGALALTSAVALLTVAVLWRSRLRNPLWVAGALVFLAALLPVLGLTTFQFQQFSTVADRYVFLPMLGVALVVGSAAQRLSVRITAVLGVGLIVALGLLSRAQVHVWHDTYSLFEHTLEVNPRSPLAHAVLGYTSRQDGRLANAIEHFRAALAIDPSDVASRYNLANALVEMGQIDEALSHYREAARRAPRDPRIRINLGAVQAQSGRYDDAVESFEAALRIDAGSEAARRGLSAVERMRNPSSIPASMPIGAR